MHPALTTSRSILLTVCSKYWYIGMAAWTSAFRPKKTISHSMSKELPKGRYLYMANGSHMAMYDDQANYFAGLTAFLKGLN